MKKVSAFIKSQNFQKYAALGVLLIILAAVPLTLSQLSHPQVTKQNAAWLSGPQTYYCNSALTVVLQPNFEQPDCSGGTNPSANHFKPSVIIKAKAGSVGAYAVHWMWGRFWCSTENPSAPCLQNGQGTVHSDGLTGDNAAFVTATAEDNTPSGQFAGLTCGYYQDDFGFYVTDNSDGSQKHLCTTNIALDPASLGQTNNIASWCHTGKACIIQPSPSPTTPIITPTDTPAITVTDTPIPTVTDTPTPGLTITPTDTPNPSDTPTPTGAPTDTPTPIIATTTPKPTLPPTGPGNAIVGAGLAGIVIAVVGIVLAIGF